MKEIKRIVNEIENKCGHKLLSLSLSGSRSIGLNDEKSDLDLYAVILPTKTNLLTGNINGNGMAIKLDNVDKIIVNEVGIENNVDVNIVDWGTFVKNFSEKVSINFIQSVLGRLYIVDERLSDVFNELLSDESIITEVQKNCFFTMFNNYKRLNKKDRNYTGSKAQFESESGYNLKDLSNLYLYYELTQKKDRTVDLYNFTEKQVQTYKAIRHNELSTVELDDLYEKCEKFIKQHYDHFSYVPLHDKSKYIEQIAEILL